MTAPLTKRLEARANATVAGLEGSLLLDEETRALLREAAAALECADGARILLRTERMRVAELRARIDSDIWIARWQLDDIRRQMEEARADGDWPLARVIGRAETAEARVRTLTSRLESFLVLDHRIRQAEQFERRYGIHIGGDSALGAVFAWIDELCARTRDALTGTDGDAQ